MACLIALHKAMLAAYDYARLVPPDRQPNVLLAALAALTREELEQFKVPLSVRLLMKTENKIRVT